MSGKRNDVANALAAIDNHYAEHRLRKQQAVLQLQAPQADSDTRKQQADSVCANDARQFA